ncbi:MAG: FMN-binding glutamate synthase family protein [Rhodospirillales bacterium]
MSARNLFYALALGGFVVTLLAGVLWSAGFFALLLIVLPYAVLGLWDIHVSKSNVLTNYPVIGHARFALEFISPEIRQYFIETNESGRPFNRLQRQQVYTRAAATADTLPFGTQYDLEAVGYHRADHSLAPKEVDKAEARVMIGGKDCSQPYSASRLNISAMSFGALSPNAIRALNKGAAIGGFAHNTGEGGLSPYHREGGGDLFWQIGTGYFGCRNKDGTFDDGAFREKAVLDQVKMIEIKLSQGAKPAHGGVLPAAKISAEISEVRGVPMGEDCISPPAHSAFSGPQGLLEFTALLREQSGGKPVGFKLALGRRSEFLSICKAMLASGITPDFITVDGGEGGTGAAPNEFSDRLGAPIQDALVFVQNALVGSGLRDRLHLIASGKTVSGFDMIKKIAVGADTVNAARTMLFAVGCIQALRCDTNTCPSGIATQDPQRNLAVDVELRQQHVANYHAATIKSFLALVGAMGLDHPNALTPNHLLRRQGDERDESYAMLYDWLEPGQLAAGDANARWSRDWALASADRF